MVLATQESLSGNIYEDNKFRPSLDGVAQAGASVPGGLISRTDSAGTFYYYGCSCNTRSQRMM
jgi:hypothetical protein